MVAQSRRRGSVVPVSVDRRWDWLLGQVRNQLFAVANNVYVVGTPKMF